MCLSFAAAPDVSQRVVSPFIQTCAHLPLSLTAITLVLGPATPMTTASSYQAPVEFRGAW